MKHFPQSLEKLYIILQNKVLNTLSWLCSFLVYFYRCFLSPYLGGACRFYPSCSEYAQQAFQEHNTIKALGLTIKRVCSCQPFGSSGYDPLHKGGNHE